MSLRAPAALDNSRISPAPAHAPGRERRGQPRSSGYSSCNTPRLARNVVFRADSADNRALRRFAPQPPPETRQKGLGLMVGDWGSLLVQFGVTAVVILGLIGVVYWLMRRYSRAALGRIGRGRVPRLAIIDAMAVDGRRRLILIRRDNVEHLLLIGGPSDVVVEHAIQRTRRPKPATTAAATTTEIDAVLQQPAEELQAAPISPTPPQPASPSRAYSGSQNGARSGSSDAERPFSFRRTTPSLPPSQNISGARHDTTTSPARHVDVQRPTSIETPPVAAASPFDVEDGEPLFPDLPIADLPAVEEEAAVPVQNGGDARTAQFDMSRPTGKSPYAKPESNGGDPGGKLADLENEMARLLGEITQKRHS